MKEVWKPVKGYEGLYEVSNMGRVRSVDHYTRVVQSKRTYEILRKGQLLIPTARQHGYLGVQLHGRGGHATRNMRTFSVHRLVAEAFVKNPLGFVEVNHLDEDKTNNRADNLEWTTRVANTNYGTCQQRRSEKIRNNNRSRKVSQYTTKGVLIQTFPSFHEASRQTGFRTANIHYAATKKANGYAYGFVWRLAD